MRNFDEERERRLSERRARWDEEGRDRSFTLGGEVFEYVEWVPLATVEKFASAIESPTDAGYIRAVAEIARDLIDTGDTEERQAETLARFDAIKHKIEFSDVEALYYWVVSEHARRPTGPSAPSGAGRGSTGESSTDDSSSQEAVASVPSPSISS